MIGVVAPLVGPLPPAGFEVDLPGSLNPSLVRLSSSHLRRARATRKRCHLKHLAFGRFAEEPTMHAFITHMRAKPGMRDEVVRLTTVMLNKTQGEDGVPVYVFSTRIGNSSGVFHTTAM